MTLTFRQALAIRRKSNDRVDVTLSALASALRRQKRFSEAEPIYRRIFEIRKHTLGPDHPDTLSDEAALAGALGDLERVTEAEPMMRRALAISEK